LGTPPSGFEPAGAVQHMPVCPSLQKPLFTGLSDGFTSVKTQSRMNLRLKRRMKPGECLFDNENIDTIVKSGRRRGYSQLHTPYEL
jgi:hypothetical protein